ncbi:MAG TPA: HAD-IIIA family hydrolase [Candidatus Solibacter sp.]|nr:HAD-IIIA family hydrolase [Candidatus Solibacter sp.]
MNDLQRRYILLDRDGVINRRRSNGPVKSWATFEFLPRSLDALRLLAANQYAAILISHQPCSLDGPQTASELDAITRRFMLEVAISAGHIAQVYYCRHWKEDGCNCYKPNTGLIERASTDYGFSLEETYFVSEQESELRVAEVAGCSCIQIQRDAFLQTQPVMAGRYLVASTLYETAEKILTLDAEREHGPIALALRQYR